METLTCSRCGYEWGREKTSGPKPKHCDPCYIIHRRERERKNYRKNQKAITERKRRWYWKNREKEILRLRAGYYKNRERRVEASRQWNVDNRERYNRNQIAAQARRRGASGSHTIEEWMKLKQRYGYRCLACGIHESFIGVLHRDHIIPLSCGGTNDIDNIQPLCQPCNSRKFTKTIDYRT